MDNLFYAANKKEGGYSFLCLTRVKLRVISTKIDGSAGYQKALPFTIQKAAIH